jgi:peptide/nickel transport system substrate-binding protein
MSPKLDRRSTIRLGAAAALAGGLAAPAVAQGNTRTLRFVPHANLSTVDPLWSSTLIAFDAAYMYADQLFGLDAALMPRPQMLAGYELSDDRLTWRFTLREGLLFHDDTPVRSQDAVASIRRWAQRDLFGKRIASQLDEMKALDDRRFEIRLRKPFAHLPYGLGATSCFILPERIVAASDAFTQIKDAVGSGPYRFLKDEWDSGTHAAFARFDKYVPRQEKPEFWSGGKVANLDRVEWLVLPDAATAAIALQKGEVDWLERPLFDLLPKLRGTAGLKVEVIDPLGSWLELYFNNAIPPFDNPALRRALFPAVVQSDFLQAIVGDQTDLMRTGAGPFLPGSPFASDVGMTALTGPRDLELARRLVRESGYKGEPVVQMAATDLPTNASPVGQQLLQSCGLNVDYQASDWGSLVNRWNAKENTGKGAWNCFVVGWAGLWITNPGSHLPLHYHKANPKMEALTELWFDAPDLPAQQKVAQDMQRLVFDDPPFIPLGQYFVPQAMRQNLTGHIKAPVTAFWNVQKG